jgi:hypothetical protein
VDAAILFADITTPLPGIGVDVEIVDGVGPVIGHPIRRREDLDRLPAAFDVDSVRPLLDAIRLLRGELDVPLIGFAGAPFTLASYLVEGGPRREAIALRRLIHGDPELAADLFDRVTTMTIAYLGAQVEAGVQAVQVFDSWIGALGPFDYEQAVAPHMRRLFEAVGGLGVPTIHFGTGAAGLLERIAAAGGDVIGLDWRIALGDGWARVPDGRSRAISIRRFCSGHGTPWNDRPVGSWRRLAVDPATSSTWAMGSCRRRIPTSSGGWSNSSTRRQAWTRATSGCRHQLRGRPNPRLIGGSSAGVAWHRRHSVGARST